MSDLYGSDAFSPQEIADRIERVGVVKARSPLLKVIMLGILAGAFIGLGAMFFTLVMADSGLTFASSRVMGGVAFSLGLLLVVVAGAELFTGNNLLVMAWADGKITADEVLANWAVVSLANFVGASGLAIVVHLSGHTSMNDGAVVDQYLRIAAAKCELPFGEAFFSGVLCNVLVCLAVWMAFAGRSVVDKAVAIVFPVTAFVAAGFEHSIANMYFIIMGMLLKGGVSSPEMAAGISWSGMFENLVPVILGNLVGGSVFVALVYHVIYGRRKNT